MVTRVAVLTGLLLLSCGAPPAAVPAPVADASVATPEPSASAASASADGGAADAAPAIATAKPAPAEEPAGTPKERLMRMHFKETAQIRTAIINGSLPETVAPAAALGKMEGLGTVPAAWRPSIDAMQGAARRIGQSSDMPGAAAALADVGAACGSCHRGLGGPKGKFDPAPTGDDSMSGRMKRHVWATERLWEGLYVPSDASWKAGVDALSGEPFAKDLLDKGGVHARSSAARFKTLVATAGSKQKVDDRAKLYAALLETCSACHIATRGK
jgi:hypothetical protein